MSKQIPLTQGRVAIVDDEDFDWLTQHKWYAHKVQGAYYAGRTVKGGPKQYVLHIHRAIMGLRPGDKRDVDHVNHNGLDNRKVNLRVCAHYQNLYNQGRRVGAKSQYKGVTWNHQKKKWVAQITIGPRNINLGGYDSETDAAFAYNNAALKLRGSFAHINDVVGVS